MTSLLERTINTHQDRLYVGSTVASIGVAVLANDDRRADGPLRQIVVEGHSRLVEEREKVLAMTPQPFDQPFCLSVVPRRCDHFVQTLRQALPPGRPALGRDIRFPPQTDGV